jgi:hypothetical protein
MPKFGQSLLLVFLAANLIAGKKKNKAAPAPPPAEEAPVEEVAPAPEPEPALVKNADFRAKLSFMDGQVTEGQVVRVERSEDWFSERGWTDKPIKLTVTVDGSGTEKDVVWSDIKSMDISYDGPGAVDCTYDSVYSPIMYMCVMKTHSKVSIAEGGSWSAAGRHKWRFIFEDGKTEEFWIYKINAREQASGSSGFDVDVAEETALYQRLQAQVATDAAGHVIKRLEISAP